MSDGSCYFFNLSLLSTCPAKHSGQLVLEELLQRKGRIWDLGLLPTRPIPSLLAPGCCQPRVPRQCHLSAPALVTQHSTKQPSMSASPSHPIPPTWEPSAMPRWVLHVVPVASPGDVPPTRGPQRGGTAQASPTGTRLGLYWALTTAL